MVNTAFQGDTGAVKAVMKRLQRGSHKRSVRGGSATASRNSSVSKTRSAADKGKKGDLALSVMAVRLADVHPRIQLLDQSKRKAA